MAGIPFGARTALITGSSRGIGRGIAVKLAQCGARRLGIHYHQNREAAEQTRQIIEAAGAEAFLVQADVSKPAEVSRMFDEVKDALSPLDIFVANARPDIEHFYQPVFNLPLEQWHVAMDSQATAFLVAVREAVQLMPDGGRIVAITYAPGGRTGSWQPWAAMGPAKAAMESLCRYFAYALGPRRITVNAVSPTATEDSVFSTLPPQVLEMLRSWAAAGWVPMGRLATPADVGDVVALLCTEEAGFVTGQTLHVDGGASVALGELPMELQAAG